MLKSNKKQNETCIWKKINRKEQDPRGYNQPKAHQTQPQIQAIQM